MKNYDYIYADPTGNITILVRDEADPAERTGISDYLCALEPACEQVGFISYGKENADIRLDMAGGEFCGNATMTTACLFARDNGIKPGEERTVTVSASGTKEPVKVVVSLDNSGVFSGHVSMPSPNSVERVTLEFNGHDYDLPLVRFDGMYHSIIEAEGFKDLSFGDAEKAIVKWADELHTAGMGIMYLDESKKTLTPLVYVPALKEFYWEHSCASGTTASGYFLFTKNGKPVDIDFKEPGGTLNIKVNGKDDITLSGHVKFRD